jgi:hypothetical protein
MVRRPSSSTRHHNAVSLTTLQTFALRDSLIEKPWFKKLEKPRMGHRERIPSADGPDGACQRHDDRDLPAPRCDGIGEWQDRLPQVWDDAGPAAAG